MPERDKYDDAIRTLEEFRADFAQDAELVTRRAFRGMLTAYSERMSLAIEALREKQQRENLPQKSAKDCMDGS